MDAFLLPYAIIGGTALVLFVAWWLFRTTLVAIVRRIAAGTVAAVRHHDPPATVAPGADAWSCANCRSVNRPDATICYSCRGPRSEVEHLQGRM